MSPQTVQEPLSFATLGTTTPTTVEAATARQGDAERMRQAAGSRDHNDLPHSCGRCGGRWSGSLTSHCGVCHHTFGGVAPFDRHRPDGHCVTPLEVGLSPLPGRAYACWGQTETDAAEVSR
jgi:hypothetical protein